ncbi:MAG: PqqD family protein [Clostridia bacterium]|nr:PqqD family protein [Clostridia bacterium]
MRINQDFTMQKVGSTYVAVPVGEASKHFHAMVNLNGTAAFLWSLMAEKDCTQEDLVEALLAEYDVSRQVAEQDVARVVELLREHHILV